MFTVSHKAGALVDLLNVFRDEDINLTMITSRPSKKRNWEYYFFVDAQGHIEDASMQRAVAGARDHCLQLSVLGSFPISGEPT
jgi:chorismate mutase/prephenate dehydratase